MPKSRAAMTQEVEPQPPMQGGACAEVGSVIPLQRGVRRTHDRAAGSGADDAAGLGGDQALMVEGDEQQRFQRWHSMAGNSRP